MNHISLYYLNWLFCSINEHEISPESNSVQTLRLKSMCEACTKKCQSFSVEGGRYMEEEVPRVSSRQRRCLCRQKRLWYLLFFSEWKFDLSLLSSTEFTHSRTMLYNVFDKATIHLLHCWFSEMLWAKLESRAKKIREKPLLQSYTQTILSAYYF